MELSVPPAHRDTDAAPCVITTDRAVLVHLHVGANAGKVQSRGRMWGVALGKLVLFKPNPEGGGRTGWRCPQTGVVQCRRRCWERAEGVPGGALGAAVEGSGSAKGLMPNRMELPH